MGRIEARFNPSAGEIAGSPVNALQRSHLNPKPAPAPHSLSVVPERRAVWATCASSADLRCVYYYKKHSMANTNNWY
jgi:hypothetical protein